MGFLRLLAGGFVAALLIIAGLGGAGWWLYHEAQRAGPLAAAKTLVVPAHSGVPAIAELLTAEGVVRRKLVFELSARISPRGAALKAGEYEFPAGASTIQTLDILASGKTVKHRLLIPEGLTSAQILALVQGAPALDGDSGAAPAEGELLPDTYIYSHGDSRKELIERMRRARTHLVAQLWGERRADLPLQNPQEATILASIIEKETAREEERPHIAGVFINRLRLGMRLQADPTVLFAVRGDADKLDRPLSHADLVVNSPYNTYLVKGLPPGPIANPGRASLRAAIRPERTEDLYFVADGSGGHVFAKTLADQTRNIALYRRSAALDPEAAAIAAPEPPPEVPPPKPAAAAPRPPHSAPASRCHHGAGHPCPH
jgi:UPF0755 protein